MPTNRYQHPTPGILGGAADWMANSTMLAGIRRAVMSRLPFLQLASEVSDVVYLNWMVDVEAVRGFVPAGVALWQRNGKTPFTILTYQHGHFGPALLGPLRQIFPSPAQSNWRLYLDAAPAGAPQVRTILFLKNIMSDALYAFGTRMLSDALPTHLADRFIHRRDISSIRTEINSGDGSAPSLTCTVKLESEKSLPPAFAAAFPSWAEAVGYLACQEAAVAYVDPPGKLALAEIELPIDLTKVQPALLADQSLVCPFVAALKPEAEPFCFVVPQVRFRALSERLL